MPAGDRPVLDREVAFRFALDLTADKEHLAWQLAGSRRFVYNRLLEGVCDRMTARVWEAELGAEPWTPWGWGKLDLIRQVKALRAAHPWLASQPWDVAECAAADLARALENDSASRRGARKGRPVGFPKRKSRKAPRQSFRLRHPPSSTSKGTSSRSPAWPEPPSDGSIRSSHARRHDTPGAPRPLKSAVPVGVDLGVRTLATAADANGVPVKVWEGVKSHRAAQRKLRRANKALARTKPGSKGHRRAVDKLRRLHARTHGLRHDLLYQASTWLVDRHQTVVIEDLNVIGMLADRRLALGAADQAMATLRQLLSYKATWYGTDLVVADRFYPSSRTCSAAGCGYLNAGIGRGDSHWTCPRCGTGHDRDHNAAVNLARWPARTTQQPAA